jgi:hypothetical protein
MSLSADTPFTVGIVGATGAVGKEIRQVLEDRQFPIEKLRIFGSERSAGSTISTQAHGDVVVELFSESAARECDVVFLAVSGDFALEHARALTAGDDGCVCIDNSVRTNPLRSFLDDSFELIFSTRIRSLPFDTNPMFLWLFPRSMVKKPRNRSLLPTRIVPRPLL